MLDLRLLSILPDALCRDAFPPVWPWVTETPLPLTHDVHVWRFSLHGSSDEDALGACLDAFECERAARFYKEQHRRRFMAFRGQLRHILGQYLGLPPSEVPLDTDHQGKPVLAPGAGLPELQFNVAHSEDIALYACYARGAVGVDLEIRQSRRFTSLDGLIERVLDAEERRYVSALPEVEQPDVFLALWSLKEAAVKASGVGLRMALNRINGLDALRNGWDLWTDADGVVYRRAPFMLAEHAAAGAVVAELSDLGRPASTR